MRITKRFWRRRTRCWGSRCERRKGLGCVWCVGVLVGLYKSVHHRFIAWGENSISNQDYRCTCTTGRCAHGQHTTRRQLLPQHSPNGMQPTNRFSHLHRSQWTVHTIGHAHPAPRYRRGTINSRQTPPPTCFQTAVCCCFTKQGRKKITTS
jgi:hypothetical protein